ncbi:Alternative cytochrome c oxidase subunit 2 [bacterium HR17]|uniref:Cytochrome c oxidase subunit 2 n=1 Tax=Candidatus Fervidibacter japonicus TaxID=2035412 RepID=A0A2H5XAP8_9BACT|nr:Alternative cytochrome c oxidase subunit 2 [bacterium HR17]
MRRKRGQMDGVVLALLLVLLVLAAAITVAGSKKFGWWLRPLASEHGAAIDRLFVTTLVITGVVFILVQLLLAFLVFRYRGEAGRRAVFYPDNPRLELAWTIVPAVILTMLILSGGRLWSRIQLSSPPPDAFVVEVWGQQFKWAIRYPGKDGKFGRVDMRLISGDNPLGIDTKDPASKDDIFFPAGEGELHVPVNKPVVVYLRSKDVIHSFYVPHFRVKQDAVPGMVTRVWFVPTRKGQFEIACAELCGQGHYTMRGILIVEDEAQVQEWLAQQSTVADLIP